MALFVGGGGDDARYGGISCANSTGSGGLDNTRAASGGGAISSAAVPCNVCSGSTSAAEKYFQSARAGIDKQPLPVRSGVVCVVPCVRWLRHKLAESVRGRHCFHAAARLRDELAVSTELDVAHDEELVNSDSR